MLKIMENSVQLQNRMSTLTQSVKTLWGTTEGLKKKLTQTPDEILPTEKLNCLREELVELNSNGYQISWNEYPCFWETWYGLFFHTVFCFMLFPCYELFMTIWSAFNSPPDDRRFLLCLILFLLPLLFYFTIYLLSLMVSLFHGPFSISVINIQYLGKLLISFLTFMSFVLERRKWNVIILSLMWLIRIWWFSELL